jgi:hypothetical protein
MNALIIDCEIENCIVPPWFKPDTLSDLPVGEQYYNDRIDYLNSKKEKWSKDFWLDKLKAANSDCINPITNNPYVFCDGWDDYDGMGLAVIGVRDCLTKENLFFTRDQLQEFQELLNQRDFLIAFNSVRFDNNLLKAQGIELKPTFDILRALWRSSGLDPNEFTNNHKGYGLEQIAILNQVGRKSGKGALAPILWQQGKKQEVIDYCLQDVELLRQVLYKATINQLVHPISGERIKLDVVLEY